MVYKLSLKNIIIYIMFNRLSLHVANNYNIYKRKTEGRHVKREPVEIIIKVIDR